MTITTNPSRDEYISSAGQTVFNYTFKIYANNELDVYVTPAGQQANDATDITTDYVVDPVTIGDENGGFITFNTPLNSGDAVTIVSGMDYDRTVDYQVNGDFIPSTVNTDNDRQVSQIKQVLELARKAVVFGQAQQSTSGLTSEAPEAGKFIRWKDDLSGFENTDLQDLNAITISNVDVIYPTVALMKADSLNVLEVGSRVSTQGYYVAGDDGGATYLIADPQSVDEFGDHTLDNGNVALIQNNDIVNVRQYGAKGDRIQDDSVFIQAAIDYTLSNGNQGVFIPTAPPNGSIRGYYRCNSPLIIYDNTHIFGEGPHASELRFLNDTNGIETNTGSIISNWTIEGLHIRGNADTSSSATKTVCIAVGPANYFTMKDLYIQRFVDGIEFDAESSGLALGAVDRVRVVNTQFPNTVNSFPRYGINFNGVTKKPQAIKFDSCIVYAEINVKEGVFSGDAIITDFEITGIQGLYKTDGVQVWVKPAGEYYYVRQVEGVDYDLWNTTSTPVMITPGTPADSAITAVEARFSVAPPSGSDVRVHWNDPTGVRGINLLTGTGNQFVGLAVGGWDTNVYVNEDANYIDIPYMQIAQVGIQLTSNAKSCTVVPYEYSNKDIVTQYSISGDASVATTNLGAGRSANRIELTADYLATTSSDPIDWDGAGTTFLQVDVPNPSMAHEVSANISWRGVEAVGSRVRVTFVLERSEDNGNTWVAMDTLQEDYSFGGVTSMSIDTRSTLTAVDTTFNVPQYSSQGRVLYRVTMDRLNGDTITALGSGSFSSSLTATAVNRT